MVFFHRFVPAVRVFSNEALGEAKLSEANMPVDNVPQVASSLIPIICVATAPADPTSAIIALAKRKHKRVSLQTLNSQGADLQDKTTSTDGGIHAMDEQNALRHLLLKDAETGCWLVLQNAHVYPHRLQAVELFLHDASDRAEGIPSTFRLWITTHETNALPDTLVLISIKVAMEPPVGVKASMQALYDEAIDQVRVHVSLSQLQQPRVPSHHFLERVNCIWYTLRPR